MKGSASCLHETPAFRGVSISLVTQLHHLLALRTLRQLFAVEAISASTGVSLATFAGVRGVLAHSVVSCQEERS